MAEIDLEGTRQALTERLDELQRSTDSTADSRKPVELDQASVGRLSRMDAMQMQAMAQATERLRGQQIDRVRAALKRIDDGDYGYCVACGEEIEPKRLAVDLTVPTCIDCASGARRSP
ncbi:TraR/DksA C4-type zinc finger protein [Thalassobaculum sp.]|uniref:TraR/DksA family transcriptional regulator n=1 Tax=Thalassobaculum sp. TaxID=2022740 RepID=UPI0032F02FE3